jgi:hypothetical protein
MGGTCSTHGEDEKFVLGFHRKTKGEMALEGIDWIQLAQDWVHWWESVNTVMKIRVP